MPDRMLDTLDLVKRSHAGDKEALDALFARYYPRVLKVVRLRMGAKLRGRVESIDVLQETFTAAVRIFDRFEMRNEASFINWLSKIAERTIHDLSDDMAAQKRDPRREVSLNQTGVQTGGLDLDAGLAVPLDQLIAGEEQAIVEGCLGELPDEWRQCLLLRNWVGLSFQEIAEEMARPTEGAARMLHARAMRELARLVAAKQGE